MAQNDAQRRMTPLNREFAARGLYRIGYAAKLIGCDRALLERHVKSRKGLGVSFEWKPGVWFTGIPIEEVERIAVGFRHG